MDINFLGSILDSVVNPDLTLLLELSPEVSWSRREHWEAYETGAWDGYDGQEKENFISYQSNIASQLRGLSHENWVTLDVNDKGETFVTEMAFNKVINQLNI